MQIARSNGAIMFLERTIELAVEAGNAIMCCYGTEAFDQKVDRSPVTAADRAAHTIILEGLSRWDASIPAISEESGVPEYEMRRHWRRLWLVDPLDGTKEFLAGNGEFTVNIALIEDGEPAFGVIVAPALKTIYCAARDVGAWVRHDGGPTVPLAGARRSHEVIRIVESRSHPSAKLEAFIATLGPVQRTALGSSLKFCRVADGAADMYPRFGPTMEWDVAAGDCIYRNSGRGGRRRPSPLTYNQPSLSTNEFVIGDLARR